MADVVTTETTDLATHVWPCTGQLERCDLTVIHDVLTPSVMCQYTGAVLAPAAERRPMWWAFAELGRRIGVDVFPDLDLGTASDDDTLELRTAGSTARVSTTSAAPEKPANRSRPTARCSGGCTSACSATVAGGSRRPSVRQLDEVRHPAQLVLIPQRQVRHQNTQHRRLGDRPYVQINPVDAAAVSIADGDQVVVSSTTGSVTASRLRHRRHTVGAVSIPHGWADPCVNTLVSDRDIEYSLTGMPRQSGTPVALAREATS